MKNDVVRWNIAGKKRRLTENLNDWSCAHNRSSKILMLSRCSKSDEPLFQSYICDNNVYNIYLVKKILAGSRLVYREMRFWHKYLYQQLHGNQSCRTGNSWIWLFQLYTVMLLFLNIGLVASANIEKDVSLNYNRLPYELDYVDDGDNSTGHFTHTWAVHIPNGEKDGKADTVALDHGFVNLGKIFGDHYHFAHHRVSKRSLTPSALHQNRLDEDKRVHWAQQQVAKSRRKRDFIRMRPSRTSAARSSLSMVDAVPFNDPKWPHMWYLNRGGDLDMNVIPAWKEGITGKGIVVTILDDGLESDHPDIVHNYDPKASYDVNSHDEDPMPHYDLTDSNRHGTRCAGEVAATANNSICAVGIAFGASVGGVRMLDGDVTDAVEARSLSLNPQHIDIYSASWGPDDDGKTVDGPGELASRAFIEGVTKGRAGKGSIFIWASGNGGRELDNCNCDGYTNSIWTLSISSATEEGYVPWYSEKCSSTLATTYSSGSQAEKQVVTTDLHHSCTVSHTGTSASAPLAAGIVALVLESNRNLTWRDMQHIVVRTAKPANLIDPTWTKNGVGRRVSHSFGYGLMDASAMVNTARNWKTVPEQQRCEINAPHVDKVIPPKSHITLQLSVKNCLNINFLEHVQAKITLTSQRRGEIQLNLISPAGTKVTLLTSRVHDTSHSGFNQWPFMSVHTWGESPHGNWQLEVHNEGRYMGHALLREWSLIFYGTTQPIDPNDHVSTPRTNLDITTPNSSSTTTSLYQIYSAQYPRISPNNFIISKVGSTGKIASSKISNKPVYGTASNEPSSQTASNKKLSTKQGPPSSLSSNSKSTKINKNSKGKIQENSKSSKVGTGSSGGKSSKQKENNPVSAQVPKNKYYRILQQNKVTSPKTPQSSLENVKTKNFQTQHSAERLKSAYATKENRKVIGDLPITFSAKESSTGGSATSISKLHIKATKQVKEPYSTKQTLSTTDVHFPSRGSSGSSSIQSNQRITKLFERYEKIQSIFPEFHPYQSGVKDREQNGNLTDLRVVIRTNNSESESQFLTSGIASGTIASFAKSSNENVRKLSSSYVPDQKIMKKQQILLAAAGVSGETVSVASTQRKNSNAQITQWDLIFFGTEGPAQTDDPIPINSKQSSSFGSEIEHNDIDSNSQWSNMEQLSETSMMTHDRTNTSCLKTTINRQCLVCAPPTALYRGRCLEKCPSHTYVSKHDSQEEDANTINSIATTATHEASYDEMSLNNVGIKMMDGYQVDNVLLTRGGSITSCEACDKSCLHCHGPLSSECTSCYTGSQLRTMPHTSESYCINFSERSSGNAIVNPSPRGFSSILFTVLLVSFVIVIILVIVLTKYNKISLVGKPRYDPKTNYTYDRLAVTGDDEDEHEDVDDNVPLPTTEVKLVYTEISESEASKPILTGLD